MANLISVDATLQQLLSAPEQSKTVEKVPLLEALGRVTAQPLVSTLDVPIRDNSAMDGYALRLEDIDEANQLPVTLRIPAGTAPGALEPQCAARIFTGAYIPEGADTVVQQEHVDVNNDHITITRRPELGANIRRQGEDIQHQVLGKFLRISQQIVFQCYIFHLIMSTRTRSGYGAYRNLTLL
jgi:molybdopterin molybdotransferase